MALLLLAGPALGQGLQSNCQAIASEARVELASLGAPVPGKLRIRYLAHAEFALQSPGGVLAVTDYNGLLGNPDVVPDVVTMNHAHDSHYTDTPDPRIPVVLKGWPMGGRPAYFDLQLRDLHLRNVTTDTRGPFGEGAEKDGNSIVLIEAAGLCVAHLGHLHQIPNDVQRASIGRVDVLFLPVDGGYTMNLDAMLEVERVLHPRVTIPMHWFSEASLQRFLAAEAVTHDIRDMGGPELVLGLDDLPERPVVVLLRPDLIP